MHNGDNSPKATHLFIYGPPASGKTTLGRLVAKALGWPHIDLDAEIERIHHKSAAEIIEKTGLEKFRKFEATDLVTCIHQAKTPTVFSLGGGTLLNDESRALVEKHGIVWCLDTPPQDELARRIAKDGAKRPLGDMSQKRAKHYATFNRRVAATFHLPSSVIVVGTNLGNPDFFSKLVIADKNAPIEQQNRAAYETITCGESRKNLASVSYIWRLLAKRNISRHDTIASFGGGTCGDLVGFAAATWMRGIPWINFPTTLLSMIDASVGGKTGFDLPEGKNLVGAFHHPGLVIADTDHLGTLPKQERTNGFAELIKHEIISGKKQITDFAVRPTPAQLATSIAVKVAIVRDDPDETKGKRIILNCGHTVAHALEAASHYTIPHGDAVAIGCVEEARIAVALGWANADWPKELSKRFIEAGLPVGTDQFTIGELIPFMRSDKKHEGHNVTFALPCAPCKVLCSSVDLNKLEMLLAPQGVKGIGICNG